MPENEVITEELNKLIDKCHKAGGHVYLTDKLHNDFIIRLSQPIKITAFIPTKREERTDDG